MEGNNICDEKFEKSNYDSTVKPLCNTLAQLSHHHTNRCLVF